MNEQPKKRTWFQIHLSTAIVMMFVAGGLIWVNLREQWFDVLTLSNQPGAYGWPFPAVYNDAIYPPAPEKVWWSCSIDQTIYFVRYRLIWDAATAFILIASAWFLCEWLIRRRAARKDA
jgi:hypothetical protein